MVDRERGVVSDRDLAGHGTGREGTGRRQDAGGGGGAAAAGRQSCGRRAAVPAVNPGCCGRQNASAGGPQPAAASPATEPSPTQEKKDARQILTS